jgi:peptide chain release factor 3
MTVTASIFWIRPSPDFSEDTYRTLIAADSAVMLIDAAKGVEAQTIKLFNVTRKAGIPVFTFVNKMDRAARDPFELMEEIEKVLGIRCCPITWPIGVDGDFQGVLHRAKGEFELFTGGSHGAKQVDVQRLKLDEAGGVLADHYLTRLADESELLDAQGTSLTLKSARSQLSPMFLAAR